MSGIKEIKEVLVAAKEIALVAKAVLKDGKVSVEDLAQVMALVAKADVLKLAIEGIGDVVPEAKDISLDEAAELVVLAIDIAKEVKSA